MVIEARRINWLSKTRVRRVQRRTKRGQQLWENCSAMLFGGDMPRASRTSISFSHIARQANKFALGRSGSLLSTTTLRPLSSVMHTDVLSPGLMVSSWPLTHNLSPRSKISSHREVVVERRWSWSSVTDSDELFGKTRAVSRLPQYLHVTSASRSGG